MPLKRAYTQIKDEEDAIKHLYDCLINEETSTIILFCSSGYNVMVLGDKIKKYFGDKTVVACTTSGEICEDGYINNGITGLSLSKEFGNFEVLSINDIKNFDEKKSETLANDYKASNPEFLSNPNKFVGLLLVDGLSKSEDIVINNIAKSFHPMQVIGGSSGDDLKFKNAFIYQDGVFVQDSAILLIIESFLPFTTFKTHHFFETDKKLVVTSGDFNERIVYELNAEAAGIEYAGALGLKPEELTNEVFAKHPLVMILGKELYVRSIAQMREDFSLELYSAIEEGSVLTIAEGIDIVDNLKLELANIKLLLGDIELIIAFDCILRRIEVESKNITREMNEIFKSEKFFGFNTYGEQCDAVHVNQTLTGIAFGFNRK